jgi:micrococcal nuclease
MIVARTHRARAGDRSYPTRRRSPLRRLPCRVCLAGALLLAVHHLGSGTRATASTLDAFHATIAYAVDGDTLRIREPGGDLDYVRLVGIDTPEDVKPGYPSECGSKAAARSMEQLAPEGAEVTLRYASAADHEDVYGRILAHAFIVGRQLELAQLRRGWAYVYRYDGLSRFYSAQDQARSARRGVWGSCGGDFHSAEPGRQDQAGRRRASLPSAMGVRGAERSRTGAPGRPEWEGGIGLTHQRGGRDV